MLDLRKPVRLSAAACLGAALMTTSAVADWYGPALTNWYGLAWASGYGRAYYAPVVRHSYAPPIYVSGYYGRRYSYGGPYSYLPAPYYRYRAAYFGRQPSFYGATNWRLQRERDRRDALSY